MLKSLILEPTEYTPKIFLNQQTGIFEVSGRSFPEDASRFYFPVLNWIEEYVQEPCQKTLFYFNLEYFNSSSLKQLLEILLKLEKIAGAGNSVKVIWSYDLEDDLMAAKGQELQNIVNLTFELKAE
jgi:SiaC family regulatory phosphoprotein